MTALDRDLERVRDVTSNLFFWQGLRFVPVGVVLLLCSARYAAWWPLDAAWNDAYLIALLLAGVAASASAGSYYARAYGRVRPIPGVHATRTLAKWVIVYPAMAISLIVDVAFSPPLFGTGIVWGLSVLLYWRSTGGGRPHYAGAALVLMSTALWPTLHLALPGLPMVNAFLALLGLVYVVCGLLDHLELRRVLRRIPDDV